MRKTVVALAIAAPLALSGTAVAAPPEPVGSMPAQEFEFCGTTVLVEELVQKQRIHKNGLATGQLKVRFTNLETGRVVDVNASGPGRGSGTEAGGVATFTFQATGRNVVFPFTAGEAAAFRAAGLPEAFTSSGPIDLAGMVDLVTDEASVVVNRRPPHIVDLCAQLT